MTMEARSPEYLYPLVETLILRLKRDGATKLAAILDHRMHKVAWTTARELLEEIASVLADAEQDEDALTQESRDQVASVMAGISSLLKKRPPSSDG